MNVDGTPADPMAGRADASGPPTGTDELVVTRDGSIATLWLNRPEKRNAVTCAMWNGIVEICNTLGADDEVRVLVVRGTGDHFCAGADVAGLADVDAADYRAANRAADEALAGFPKPTVAFITGACVGGGAEIAIACDLRIADETARFGITPARLGIIYPGSALERACDLIGAAALKHLLYTAELIDAERALQIGLVNEVRTPIDAVRRLDELTSLIANERSSMTQQATKAMLADIAESGHVQARTEQLWEEVMADSPDPLEGVVAFLERRTPRFTWPTSS